jgi:subtilisin family serine protease
MEPTEVSSGQRNSPGEGFVGVRREKGLPGGVRLLMIRGPKRKELTMWKAFWLVLLLAGVGLVAGPVARSGDDKARLVIMAKASDKLSSELNAAALSGGTLLGRTRDGGAVVELADKGQVAKLATVAAITKVEETVPAQFEKVERLIILYKPGQELPAEQLKESGFKVVKHNKEGNFYVVTPAEPGIQAKAVAGLAAVPSVRFVEPDYQVRIPPQPADKPPAQNGAGQGALQAAPAGTIPNDTQFNKLWGMRNIQAPIAWDKVHDSKVIVAVIDTGVDYKHPDLAGNMWRNTAETPGDGIDNDNNGVVDDVHGADFVNGDGDPMDDNRHGTHCAGTIGAVGNNAQGVAGVCWKVQIMALKFLDAGGSGSTSDAVDCIDYARKHGAKIMSNSWGGGGPSQALADAITRAEQAGILFMAAAGNTPDNDNDANPHYPSSYDNKNVIAVLSIDSDHRKSSFSCFGATSVDIGAPGGRETTSGIRILSTVPNNGYAELSGTSMATPHVSGAAALVWAHPKYQNAAWQDVREALLKNARASQNLAGKCVTGGTLDLQFLR